MSYVAEHASALADVRAAGAAITFTKGAASCAGFAIEDEPDHEQFAELGLTQMEAKKLFFVASTYGEAPLLGSTGAWGSKTFAVKAPGTYAPDGIALYSEPVVAR